jgi:drug/metabolite transporter (DMT)-like permease
MNVRLAISIKLLSVLLFAVMSTLVRFVGQNVPLGQVVFFRSAFAILPVVVIYAWRGELAGAVRTGRPLGHVGRGLISVAGMFLNFAALARLPSMPPRSRSPLRSLRSRSQRSSSRSGCGSIAGRRLRSALPACW